MMKLIMARLILSNICARASRRKRTILIVVATVLMMVLMIVPYRYWKSYTGSSFSVHVLIFGEKTLPQAKQSQIDYIAANVAVEYTVRDNFASGQLFGAGGYFLSTLTLVNHGSRTVPATRWAIYGYLFRILEPGWYPYPGGFYLNKCGLKVFHVGGYLYRFEPVGNFYSKIWPKESRTCVLKAAGFQVTRTDSFPNWYVVGSDLTPKIIKSTASDELSYVGEFSSVQQYKRRADDPYTPYTPPERYRLQQTAAGIAAVDVAPVIPTPLEIQLDKVNTLDWNTATWYLVNSKDFPAEVKHLAQILKMKIVASKPTRRYIIFSKVPVTTRINSKDQELPEAYSITTNTQLFIININTNTNTGAFYAIQTLLRLLATPGVLKPVGVPLVIPSFTVTDAPRYSHRGLMIDVARNFIDKAQIKKVMDVMAMYKMNKLHLHLADDEGWRLEIPGIPELTNIGAQRCHDIEEEQCILPMLGSGPFANTSGSGFYSVGDYREILQHAKDRHIEIIPEFDMPGHSRAAIKSIHAKSQQSHRKQMNAQMYAIIDEHDASVYKSGQHFTDDVVDPCLNSTYVFVTKIMTEVKKLHAGVQPLKFYHFGGDEVAEAAWSESPQCKGLQRRRPDLKTHFDLKKYFIKNIASIAAGKDMSIGAWEDGLLDYDKVDTDVKIPFRRESFKNKEIYVFVWTRPVQKLTPHRTVLFANDGYKVILAYASYLYLDHAYEPDPEERGLNWATRKVDTRDAWSFSQQVIFADKHLDCPRGIQDKTDCMVLKKPENIVGIQAELWTETVRTNDDVDYMLFPRLLAVAERAWHKASWETDSDSVDNKEKDSDWLRFITILGSKELLTLDSLGVKYRVPPPGAVVINGRLRFNVEFPALDVQYFSEPSQTWDLASHNMRIEHTLKLRTKSADGKRYSRVVTVHPSDTASSAHSTGNSRSWLLSMGFVLYTILFTHYQHK